MAPILLHTKPLPRGVFATLCALTLTAGSAMAENERTPLKVYESTCAYCHGRMIAPGISVAPVLLGRQLNPETVSSFVRKGPGKMQPFRETELSNAELKALEKWIQTSPAPALMPTPGAAP